ncbi:polysaccharide biosynthesis tyrosine autokinase [Microbacterium sp. 22242]|uniref:polysaccharide biosynthesis tyrosine autokinase n=1 Tax=Microbacterium sp. 22242 TaxID=3453896 RepID=UPI003F8756AE
MTVLDLITLIRRGWKYLFLGVVLGALAGFGYGLVATPVYSSQATGFIAATGTSVVAGSDEAVARAGAYMPLIDSSQVRDEIAKDAGVPASELHGTLSARVVPGSTLVEVTANASDPRSALKLANGALHALAKVVAHIEEVAGAAATPAPGTPTTATTGTPATATTGAATDGIAIVPMDEAVAPTRPSAPNKPLAIGLGALAGLVFGLIVMLLRRALDVRVRAHTDIPALVGTGVLGRVPKLDRRRRGKKDALARAVAHEAYRQIRTGLRFSSVDQEVRVVMVTSANLGEGKSEVARSLARALAESGQRTLVIDGDLRRPTVATGFEIDGAVGLSEVLSGQVPVASAIQRTADPNLFVLPAGGIPPNPSEMLGSSALQHLLAELRRDFYIVVDAPPVLPVTDASVLSTVVDGLVFVVAMGRTRRSEVVETRTLLAQTRARILGVVLNMVSLRGGDNGYGYYQKNSRYYVQSRRAEEDEDAIAEFAAMANLSPASFDAPQEAAAGGRDDEAAGDGGPREVRDDDGTDGGVALVPATRPRLHRTAVPRVPITSRAQDEPAEPVGPEDPSAVVGPRYARRNSQP